MICSAAVISAFVYVGEMMRPQKYVPLPNVVVNSRYMELLDPTHGLAGAIYTSDNPGTITLPDGFDCDNERNQSMIIHEMTHHYQKYTIKDGTNYDYETPAYGMQNQWLKEHGATNFFEVHKG